jgi:tripartite-type tricarboxylate transporter receptor subunit TctC
MKKFNRREFSTYVALAACAPAAHSQETWSPTRPLSLVVPFSAGGPTDAIARAIGDQLGRSLGQPVVVDNRPGAGGSIAYEHVLRAPPDGYTLGLIGSSMVANAALGPVPYDPIRSFTPVVQLLNLETLLVVHPSVPAQTVPELIDHLKRNPGRANFGSSGSGSLTHLQMEVFKALTGTHVVHIPYRGSSATVIDLVAGQVQVCFDTIATFGPHIKTGALRLLAVAMPQRNPAYSAVPTVAESDPRLKNFDLIAWTGIAGPAGLPAPVVARLHKEVDAALKDEGVLQRLQAAGAVPASAPPQVFAKRIADEVIRTNKLVRDLGLVKSS